MPTFVVICNKPNPSLGQKIKETYPDGHYILGNNQWLVDAEETTHDLGEKLGIRDGRFGSAVAFKIDSYSGYHNKSLWEWLALP